MTEGIYSKDDFSALDATVQEPLGECLCCGHRATSTIAADWIIANVANKKLIPLVAAIRELDDFDLSSREPVERAAMQVLKVYRALLPKKGVCSGCGAAAGSCLCRDEKRS